jgi:ElaA protein
MIWHLKKFEELTPLELYNILKLRSKVFVVEQNCVYLDMDDSDQHCYHLYSYNSLNDIVAYTRLVPPGLHYLQASIGRVLSCPTVRKTGIGKTLMTTSIKYCKELFPNTAIKIGAQFYLKAFYKSFGFVQVSDIYDEDGIEHIKMLLITQ